jgi:RimJ/RimL family protein N-acetyltransferase
MLLSPVFYKYYRTVYKFVKKFLAEIIEHENLSRVQALIHPDYEDAHRFIEHLGFEREGLLKRFGPGGEDLFMYSRIGEI